MNLREEAERLGKDKSYFSVVRTANPKFFRFCRLHGKTLSDGYNKFNETSFETMDQLYIQYVEKFDDEKEFSKWLMSKGHYTTMQSGYDFSRNMCANRARLPSWDYLKKCKKILKQLKEIK